MCIRRLFLVPGLLGLSLLTLTSCGDIHHRPAVRVRPSIEVVPSTMTSTERHKLEREVAAMRARNELRLAQVRESLLQATILWNQTVAANAEAEAAAKKDAEAANTAVSADRGDGDRPAAAVSAPPVPAAPVVAVSADIASVMACIRAHESGDYTIHNHGYSGSSGAYQYLRGTWLAWSARAGLSGYDAAYLAPPAVQDAVTVFALTNGGAGNWSMRWGNDPCTRGLPGGG